MIKNDKSYVVLKEKNMETALNMVKQHETGLFVMILIVSKIKRKKYEIFPMATEEQLVNCVCHTCGLVVLFKNIFYFNY